MYTFKLEFGLQLDLNVYDVRFILCTCYTPFWCSLHTQYQPTVWCLSNITWVVGFLQASDKSIFSDSLIISKSAAYTSRKASALFVLIQANNWTRVTGFSPLNLPLKRIELFSFFPTEVIFFSGATIIIKISAVGHQVKQDKPTPKNEY